MMKNKTNNLRNLRKKIDHLDNQIIRLLKKRSFIIPKVRQIKKSWQYKIAFSREVNMANSLNKKDFGLYKTLFFQKVWRELISATLYIECSLRVLIYKNPKNYFDLWELSKDHFSGSINLEIHDNLKYIFDELINKKADCIILPDTIDTSIKWWTLLLDKKYENIKINLILPLIGEIKTLGNSKAFVLSLNKNDIDLDNLFYIIKKDCKNINEIIIDSYAGYFLVKSTLSLQNLANHLNIKKDDILPIGSSPNTIINKRK